MRLLNPFLALAILLFAASSLLGQEESLSNLGTDNYDQLINLLFPLDELENERDSVTILRYQPSFTAESQIVIIRREGYFEVVEYKSLDGNLFYKLDEMPSVRNLLPPEMLKLVHVRKREIRLPYALGQSWRRNLLASIYAYMRPKRLKYTRPPKFVNVMEDGTSYELWDTWGNWKLHFQLQGGTTDRGAPPLEAAFIRWMNVVRQEVAKRK